MTCTTYSFKIPADLAYECAEFACPDLWADTVIASYDRGNRVEITVKGADLDRVLQAICSAADVRMIEGDSPVACAQGKRWLASMRKVADRLKADQHGELTLPLTDAQLA